MIRSPKSLRQRGVRSYFSSQRMIVVGALGWIPLIFFTMSAIGGMISTQMYGGRRTALADDLAKQGSDCENPSKTGERTFDRTSEMFRFPFGLDFEDEFYLEYKARSGEWEEKVEALIFRTVPESMSNWAPAKIQAKDQPLQKLIHMLWKADADKEGKIDCLPKRYDPNVRSYAEMNPKWTLVLWVNSGCAKDKKVLDMKKLPNMKIEFWDQLPQDILDLANRWDNMGSQTDVIKFYMVYQEGGIYVDIDSTALRPFGKNFETSFVSNVAYPSYNLCAGVFGMPKHSPFLKWMFDVLKSDEYTEHVYENKFETDGWGIKVSKRTGPIFLTTAFLDYPHRDFTQIQFIHQDLLIFGREGAWTTHSNDATWLLAHEE